MTLESSLSFWRCILWGAPAIAAILVFVANFKINNIQDLIAAEKAKTDSISKAANHKEINNSQTVQINNNTGSITFSGNNNSQKTEMKEEQNENKKEKIMEEKKSGDTYNVSSTGQQGGITTGKFEVHVSKQEDADELNIPLNENYQIRVDKINKKIDFHPKVGKWEKPFIAVPFNEQGLFGSFSGKDPMLTDVQSGDFSIDGVRFYGHSSGRVSNNAKPATGSFYYSMTFKEFPTYLIFGNYEGVVFKYDPASGRTTPY